MGLKIGELRNWHNTDDARWMVSHIHHYGTPDLSQNHKIIMPTERQWFLWVYACRKLVWHVIGANTRAMIEKGYEWVDSRARWHDVLVAGNRDLDNPDNSEPPDGVGLATTIANTNLSG